MLARQNTVERPVGVGECAWKERRRREVRRLKTRVHGDKSGARRKVMEFAEAEPLFTLFFPRVPCFLPNSMHLFFAKSRQLASSKFAKCVVFSLQVQLQVNIREGGPN